MKEIIINTDNEELELQIINLFNGLKVNKASSTLLTLSGLYHLIEELGIEVDVSVENKDLTIINISKL